MYTRVFPVCQHHTPHRTHTHTHTTTQDTRHNTPQQQQHTETERDTERDKRVLLTGDFNVAVGSVRSEVIGGVGAETASKNGSRFRVFLDGNSMCTINTFVGGGK